MPQVNIFTKGIIEDIDHSRASNDSWLFPSLNLEVMNNEGQGIIITASKGNTGPIDSLHTKGEEFKLTEGFKIVGACEYKGIAYIISHNQGTGEGEIGCFPSPDTLNYDVNPNIVPVFTRTYRPLNNFTIEIPPFTNLSERLVLRSTVFNFSLDNYIDVFARESYDGSIDLFMCDYNNPNRVINSGFNQEGYLNNRLIKLADFSGSLVQTSSASDTTLSLESVESTGGTLKYGNYIVYCRYVDSSLNRTQVVAISGVCQVYNGTNDTQNTLGGIATSGQGIIKLTLNNVDTSYNAIEVLYTRYFGDIGTTIPLLENAVIDPLVLINGQNSVQIVLSSNGLADTVVGIDEINKIKINELICKSHTQIENVYYGGNWKGLRRNGSDFAALSLCVTASLNVKEHWMNDLVSVYKDYNNAYNYVGYFGTEYYPFAVVYELIDGSHSDAYPITGIDYLDNLTTNNFGYIRFPNRKDNDLHKVVNHEHARIFGLTFDLQGMNSYLNNNLALKSLIKSFKIVRGDGNKNLLYQGLTFHCARFNNFDDLATQDYSYYSRGGDNNNQDLYYYLVNPLQDYQSQVIANFHEDTQNFGADSSSTGGTNAWGRDDANNIPVYHYGDNNCPPIEPEQPGCLPIFMGYAPFTFGRKSDNDYGNDVCNYVGRAFTMPDKYAFYSIDRYFEANQGSLNTDIYVERIAESRFFDQETPNPIDHNLDELSSGGKAHWIYPRTAVYNSMHHKLLSDANDGNHAETLIYGQHNWIENLLCNAPIGGYANITTDASNIQSCAWSAVRAATISDWRRQRWSVRSMITAPYMGLNLLDNKTVSNTYTTKINYENCICNIYNTEPSSINLPTTIANVSYKQVYQTIQISELNTLNSIDVFNGDCYIANTFIKQTYWNGSPNGYVDDNIIGYDYASGTFHDINGSYGDDDNAQTKIRFTHGHVIGIVTENRYNIDMRFGVHYYNVPGFTLGQSYQWSRIPFYDVVGIGSEQVLYNPGYHENLSQKVYSGYNVNIPFYEEKFPTRIRHSAIAIPYSIVDNFRVLNLDAYKDYDNQYGSIQSVKAHGDTLVSIQEGCINKHFNNEKQVKVPASGGSQDIADLVMGFGPLLAQQVRLLAKFGTQHQSSVRVCGNDIFGWDFIRRVLWRIGTSTTSTGSPYLSAKNLTESEYIRKTITELSDLYDVRTDRVTSFGDTPYNNVGIITGYDPQLDKVLFTIKGFDYVLASDVVDNTIDNVPTDIQNLRLPLTTKIYKSRTLAFSNRIDSFICDCSFAPNIYFNINREMFTNRTLTSTDYLYLHNRNDSDINTFYGTLYPSEVSCIINGQSDSIMLNKQFLGHQIECSHIDLRRITYNTEYQNSEHDWILDANNISLLPEYLEHKWNVSINVQTSIDNDAFQTESTMMGQWLKTTIQYYDILPFFIKKIITNYIISNS